MKSVYRADSGAVPTIHTDFHWHAGILLAGTDGFEKKKSLIFTYYHESLGSVQRHYKFSKIVHNICQWQQQKYEIWTRGLVYWRLAVTAVSSAVDSPLGSANCFKWDEKSCCDCSLVIVENCAMLCIAKSNTQPCWKLFLNHTFSCKYTWC